MPRSSKPFFRKQTQSWYFSTGGKQIPLGRDKEKAIEKFHEMMLQKDELSSHLSTLYELSQLYLDWVETNRSPATYTHQRQYLKSFIGQVGRSLRIGTLKKHHLTKWLEANPQWASTTTQNDAITIVQRMLNWAVEEGYILRSPIPKVKKPKRRNREVFYTEEQWRLICGEIKGDFLDLMTFLWETGCRPQEARNLEARHVHIDQELRVG